MANKFLDQLYMVFHARFGDTAKAPFEDDFIQDQHRNFTITQRGIVSAGDTALGAMGNQVEAWEDIEELADVSEDEDEPAVTEVQVQIEALRLHIPNHFKIHSMAKAKDEASVSTTKSLKCDAVANPEIFRELLILPPPSGI